jgi:RimJ/RimL family protein N-acetyltransferase
MSDASAPPLPLLPPRPARLEHAGALAAHLVEHRAESGQEGSPHFGLPNGAPVEEVQQRLLERWSRRIDEPLWGRAWLLWSGEPPRPSPAGITPSDARVVGHVELLGGRVRAELHRATLGIGLLRPYTGQGYGRRLMEVAIAWARDEAGLDHIDLGVFVGNDRARKLYERMGFVAQWTRRDAFRVDGVVIDDIQMTLALRR